MKPIPKSSRESNRYIVCNITAKETISYEDFSDAVMQSAINMVGKLGVGSLGLQVIKDQYKFPITIIKTNAGQEQYVRAIICAITKIKNSQVKVESTKTSGTIKHVKP